MEKKYTPGPWSWQLEEGGEYSLSPGIFMTNYSDGTPWGDSLDKKNAHLISAAPDLLEALEKAVDELKQYGELTYNYEAAIRKAYGEGV